MMKKNKRKRTQTGRPPKRRARRASAEELESSPQREKILRGSENEGAVPEEASRSETEGDVRSGRVVAMRGRECLVDSLGFDEPAVCLLRKSTRVPHPTANAVAVGDHVRVLCEGDEPFMVTEVGERRTRLARIRRGRNEQVIAANVDVCAIVASAAEPRFKPGLVDRFLISAREGNLHPALVLNKVDLVDAATVDHMLAPYRRLEIPALGVSAETGEGLDALRELFAERTAVLSGQSGVGKSSLLNRLVPDLEIRTNQVYGKAGKGRHTTTASTLYPLPDGGAVIDTPGIRSFLMHAPSLESLHEYFPEVAAAAGDCRFADCSHGGDRGCAVPEALEAGTIDPGRLDSYRNLRKEIEAADRGDW